MPFETADGFDPNSAPKSRRIAVIGAGISGMGAAYKLAPHNRVTLFEAGDRIGGHARTVVAGKNGDQPVDTGFIVFNYANYPHLAELFDELDVPVVKSNMSFGASIDGGRLEYALTSFNAMFAQRRNLVNPKFIGMLRDIVKFNKTALDVAQDTSLSTAEFLAKMGTGDYFRDYYLLPLSGAIWSTPTEKIMDFPAHAMIQFFENHALLNYSGQHQWYTVEGGSASYVTRLEAAMRRHGVDIRVKAPIAAVRRDGIGVDVRTAGGDWERFDEVIFATHSDDTLSMLADPTAKEAAALGAIGYQPNDIVLHADTDIMPKRRATWASWVYTEDRDNRSERIDLTYWMNSLQPIPQDDPHFVTLNTKRTIREELIYDQVTLRHPVYDLAALAAQKDVRAFNGENGTWFCGAWMRHGFHEDGLASAVSVVRALEAKRAMALAAE
ncbi:NAD(P)/FAD-dependent oxidoreductase [Sulfitobacter sp. S190]|uniref:NAD(P)/FAD-dependent oxidoreductase n=1 Tax=Sulfitobacter sp. S190 TaxID=2867022 RepID=UPI0021A5AFE0|nr:FAD-dependent oxidoreductase [Sulfitobacter sp. S190]UWR22178.1 FAD-dependent oxidoreductase [Sulfitobacter sp. S190]